MNRKYHISSVSKLSIYLVYQNKMPGRPPSRKSVHSACPQFLEVAFPDVGFVTSLVSENVTE